MNWISLLIIFLIFIFGFVIFFGAPYLPTMNQQVGAALDLLDLKTDQTMLELGSGDGRVLKSAAKRGLKAVGYEINPLLFIVSKIVCWPYRHQITIHLGSYWSSKWPNADGIFVFSIAPRMAKLDEKIKKLPKSHIRVASFAFKIPGKQVLKQADGVYLYEYHSDKS